MKYVKDIGIKSKLAFERLKTAKHSQVVKVLDNYNKSLKINKLKIIKENIKDVRSAKRKNLIDRLILDAKRIEGIRYSINQIAKCKNPIGKVLDQWKRPNNLKIKKISTPIGVIGVIYESRPNVTADVASLSLKSGNCVILRGGSEAFYSNKILADLFRAQLTKNGLDKNCVQFIEKKNRKIVNYLLSDMGHYIDVVVPRGGRGLVEKVQKFSKIHVIGHLEGLCHIYLDKKSDFKIAKRVILNSKMRRTSICGALETLLINEKLINNRGKEIINLLEKNGCKVKVDKKINKILKNKFPLANEKDWKTEYLDSILSVKSVKNVKEAVAHILKYGTMHTDCIVSSDKKNCEYFIARVNSSIAMQNVSTQFADGGEFGFGGEIGISTNKLPPRGPVGINQLTSYKYVVTGKGVIRPK